MSDPASLDVHDLVRRTQAVREFTWSPEPGTELRLRYPSRFEGIQLDARHRGDAAALARATVELSVIGWSGVCVRHAHPETKTPGEQLPFAPETLALVLDEQVGWLVHLWTDIQRRSAERAARVEAALKNWVTESATSAAAAGATVQ